MIYVSRHITQLAIFVLFAVLSLTAQANEMNQLDVSIVIFESTAGSAGDSGTTDLDKIRVAETRYMPYVLRHYFEQSDMWGAIRVVPETDPSAEILVTTRIVEASGLTLILDITIADATGRVWLEKRYAATTTEAEYRLASKGSPLFGSTYEAVVTDAAQFGSSVASLERQRIRDVSWLRYANRLLPNAFDDYLAQSVNGIFQLKRMPASNDPMVARINRVRSYEYLFVDTVDEQYASLYGEMTPAYNGWRKYDREQKLYLEDYRERIDQREKEDRGSFQALQQLYNNYKWSKIQEQESALMASTLASELQPTVLAVEGSVVELAGSLEQRYQQWKDILRKLYLLESG